MAGASAASQGAVGVLEAGEFADDADLVGVVVVAEQVVRNPYRGERQGTWVVHLAGPCPARVVDAFEPGEGRELDQRRVGHRLRPGGRG